MESANQHTTKKHSPVSSNPIQTDFTNSLPPFPVYLPRPVPAVAVWPKLKPDVGGLKGWLKGDEF